jgi:hypothetical protein
MKAPATLCLLIAGIVGDSSAFGQSLEVDKAEAARRERVEKVRLSDYKHLMPPRKAEPPKFKHSSFTFARVKHVPTGKYGFGRSSETRWLIDYPDADLNLSARFGELTGLKTDPKGQAVTLTDSNLKQYPFIYISEPGRLEFSEAEAKNLRNYLLGGGFLMADDFWGETEWSNLQTEIKRVFPDREIVDLPLEHPLFHCFFELREKPQVPNVDVGIRSQYTGITWERPDGKQAHYRGLVGDDGKLMAVFCHNTDLADAWEREGEHQYYFQEFSLKKAYPMGINIVVYALTK